MQKVLVSAHARIEKKKFRNIFSRVERLEQKKSHIDVQFVISSKGPLDTNNILPFFDFLVFAGKDILFTKIYIIVTTFSKNSSIKIDMVRTIPILDISFVCFTFT